MATLKLEITPDLEQRLRDEAARQGLDPALYALNLLQEQLQPSSNATNHLSSLESELLQNINLGLPTETWELYDNLKAKRQDESLTSEEQTTLIAISDQIEQANVRCITALVELAKLRSQSLEQVMQDLGTIQPISTDE